jgi:REP element-mobilizing transposase RayT
MPTLNCVPFYRRRLPHAYTIGQPVFVTWRLAGSLPQNRPFVPEGASDGEAFVALDHVLDEGRSGPLYLHRPDIADILVAKLRENEQVHRHYKLHAFVVMPNHVHLLLTPNIALPDLVRFLKGATAREANKVLGTTGKPFWQDEFFDRQIRDMDEFGRIRSYIEMNPVRAGFAHDPAGFPYSSAYPQLESVPVRG